jgi:nitric oxide reductase activation protein
LKTIKNSLEEKIAQNKEEKHSTSDNQVNINRAKLDTDESRSNQTKGQLQSNTRVSRISFNTATNSTPLNENINTAARQPNSTNLKPNQENYINEEILYLNNHHNSIQKQIRPNTTTAASLSNRNNITAGMKFLSLLLVYPILLLFLLFFN